MFVCVIGVICGMHMFFNALIELIRYKIFFILFTFNILTCLIIGEYPDKIRNA
jgi:hypothetical protein